MDAMLPTKMAAEGKFKEHLKELFLLPSHRSIRMLGIKSIIHCMYMNM